MMILLYYYYYLYYLYYYYLYCTVERHLQFTMEMEGSCLHVIDLTITIKDNKLETSIYRKPTNSRLYLNARSSHPSAQIFGIARGVTLRLRRICSNEEDFEERLLVTINCIFISSGVASSPALPAQLENNFFENRRIVFSKNI